MACLDTVSDEKVLRLRTAPRLEDAMALDHVVAELREIDRRSGLTRTMAIGELVLKRFFGGDPAVWQDRRRNKNNSIRRLANHNDCPLSRSALSEALGVYVALCGLPCVRTFGHISASHVASVLSLPVEQRQDMLESAERGHWSVRELRQKVVFLRRAGGERRGRPSTCTDIRAVSAIRSLLRILEQTVGRAEQIEALGPAVRAEVRQLGTAVSRLGSRLLQMADAERDSRVAESGPEPPLRMGRR